jgi:uncharacterized protein YcbX
MATEHKQSTVLGYPLEQVMLFLYPIILIPSILVWWRQYHHNRASNIVPRGFSKLTLRRLNLSNLLDEYEDKYLVPKEPEEAAPWKVKALFIHPIKSCGAVEVESAALDGAGMLWDRKFAFAELLPPPPKKDDDEQRPKWTFRTLRQPGFERLAMVRPEIWLRDGKMEAKDQTPEDDGWLVVKFPYTPSGIFAVVDYLLLWMDLIPAESAFKVPLVPPRDHKYPSEEVTIWKDSPSWFNCGEHVPKSFQTWLGAKNPISLFRADPDSYRQLFRNAPRKSQVGYQPRVGFADAYPLHLINLASVRDVGEKVKESIPEFTARRFRPNIVVAGGVQYDEDNWKRIRVEENMLYCACHTIRCRLPNVDPFTAERHPVEPDKTLKSFRCIDDGDPLNAALGLQLVPANDRVFEVKVGDELKVMERGEHHYIKL